MKGLLLVNLGTPDAPTPAAVRRYLRELLSDPLVMDLPPIRRKLLLELVILPFRPARSAKAYRHIWTERGSPLLFHGEDLAGAVAGRLGDDWQVELGMRYGKPSLASAVHRLVEAKVEEIVLLPLYPQDALSTRGSTIEEASRALSEAAGQGEGAPRLRVLPSFHQDPGFIRAMALVARPVIEQVGADHVLMSFHGLPERQIRKADPTGAHCLISADCCDRPVEANRRCYRFQAHRTAEALASELGLFAKAWSISFQSRMGRTPWIGPHTDDVVLSLARSGVRKLAVVCPSFVADCLETIEEIGTRAREAFLGAGGDSLTLVPCVNSEPAFADAVAEMVTR